VDTSIDTYRASMLAADLDRFTARLVEIVQRKADYPQVRAYSIAESAFIAIWAYAEDPTLKAALDRFSRALAQLH
jgi:hypothetical protein